MKSVKSWKVTKGDIVLVAAVLGIAAVGALCLYAFGGAGSEAVVEVAGERVAVLPLTQDATFEVTQDGRVTNTVTVQNGRVAVSEADCPDQICVHHRAIAQNGESIVCLPNKVIVTVQSGDKEKTDGVAR